MGGGGSEGMYGANENKGPAWGTFSAHFTKPTPMKNCNCRNPKLHMCWRQVSEDKSNLETGVRAKYKNPQCLPKSPPISSHSRCCDFPFQQRAEKFKQQWRKQTIFKQQAVK